MSWIIARSKSKPVRLFYAALLMMAMLILASPLTTAATVFQTKPVQSPRSPSATCPSGGQCFADVLPSNPFYAYTNRIYQQDLVSGYDCGGNVEPCDDQHRP